MTYIPSTINIGAAPNDNTGDPARTAFSKVNDNFTGAAAAINNTTNMAALVDIGVYTPSINRYTDWLVMSRNLGTTNRISVGEAIAADVQFFFVPGTYTWVIPPNATSVRFICLGAGGGGGGGATVASGGSAGGGAGGGGGAYSEILLTSKTGTLGANFVLSGANVTVVVGAGGTAGTGKASGSAGNGDAGGNGGASYVADVTNYATPAYYAYANGGLGGQGGNTGGATNTGGAGASWLPIGGQSFSSTYMAGQTDTLSTTVCIPHPYCGGPGCGSSAANGSPSTGAITMQGGFGGSGGGAIATGVVKSPGSNGLSGLYGSPYRAFTAGTNGLFLGGAASLTANGGLGTNTTNYFGMGGSGGGAAYTAFSGGNGRPGGNGQVFAITTF